MDQVEVLFVDTAGEVLIVEPTDLATWAVPGGPVRRGEEPAAAVTRLLGEQFGLDLTPGRLLVADGEHHLFDGGALTDAQLDAIELPFGEIDSWAFVPREELFVMLAPEQCRRVTAGLDARHPGHAPP